MDRNETMNYINENFNISAEASRLINNILCYVKTQDMDEDEQHKTLFSLLDGTIGLSDSEIKKIIL